MKSGGKKAITSSKMTNLFLNCWSNNDTADFVSSVTSSTADWVRPAGLWCGRPEPEKARRIFDSLLLPAIRFDY